MPRSLQKMLRLKACSVPQHASMQVTGCCACVLSMQLVRTEQETLASRGKKGALVNSAKHRMSTHPASTQRDSAAAAAPRQASLPARQEQAPSLNGDRRQPEGGPAEACAPLQRESAQSHLDSKPGAVAQPGPVAGINKERAVAAPPAKGGMKQRKKDFLKRRKLKKRGAAGDAAEGEDLEAQLLHDAHKPKFGEQAMAPLKVLCWRHKSLQPKSCISVGAVG